MDDNKYIIPSRESFIDTYIKHKNIVKKNENDNNNINNKMVSKYISNIKNVIPLENKDLKIINDMSYQHRMKILLAYNEMVSYLLSLFDDK
jgi:hypothetical protein